MIAVSRSSGFCRLSKGSRTMNIEAKLELLACNRNELPAKATVCADAGRVACAIFSILATTALVRSKDAESGSWMFAISRPWSCCGMNPVGAL